MKYIKKFESKFYPFYSDIKKGITDKEYYLDIIKNNDIDNESIRHLFHMACMNKLNELAYSIYKGTNIDLKKLDRSLLYLDIDYFKKIIDENKDLLDYYLRDKDYIEKVIIYGNLEIFKFVTKDIELNYKMMYNSCIHSKLDIFKYLIHNGLDPYKKDEIYIEGGRKVQESCLDKALKMKINTKFIEFLIFTLNIPYSYRHLYILIRYSKFELLKIILKSDNLVDDYGYKRIEDEIFPYMVIISLLENDKLRLAKMVIKDNNVKLLYYNLNTIMEDEYLNILNRLRFAFYIIKQYDGKEHGYITDILSKGNEKFWIEKIKENPHILSVFKPENILKKYNVQKFLIEYDENVIEYLKDIIHPKIMKEYDYLDGIINIHADNYNL